MKKIISAPVYAWEGSDIKDGIKILACHDISAVIQVSPLDSTMFGIFNVKTGHSMMGPYFSSKYINAQTLRSFLISRQWKPADESQLDVTVIYEN